jgi:oligopeptide transport system substrate-binding protein
MRNGRRSTGLVALATAGILLTACGQSPASPAAAPDAVSIAIGEPESPLVPGNTLEEYGAQVLESLWTGLVGYAPDGSVEYTGVAESVESADNRTWTVRLHDGWTFHDGSPVVASSFVDAWNATAYGLNAMAASYVFADVVGYDDLQVPVGEDGEPAGEPAATEMSGLRVVDDRTFTVTLAAPFAQFPAQLGYSPFFPLPEAYFADPDAFGVRPVGNGPFRASQDYVAGEGIALERFADYAGSEPASVEAIEYRVYTDLATAYTDALAGEVDIVPSLTAEAGRTADEDFPGRYVESGAAGFTFLALPLYEERYADPRVRQGLSMAVDRQGIADAVFGGSRRAADALVAPVVPGYRAGACGYCVLDVTRANTLLDAAGFDRTEPIELWFNAGAGNDAWMEALGNQLRANLGVDFVLRGDLAPAEYGPLMDEQGMTGPFRLGWAMDYPSPQSYLAPLYATEAQPPAGSNVSFYSSAEVDELLAEGNAAPDDEQAIAAYNRAEDVLLEDMPVIPLFFSVMQSVHSAGVTGVVVDVFGRVDTAALTRTD